jgi:23S rRNA (adenine2503-C2)-methyltransferase
MTNLPAAMREELARKFRVLAGSPLEELVDSDGTVKQAVLLSDGLVVESVILVDGEGRKTACLSTQAGCPAACVFCKTGTLGLKRNLTSLEIAAQFLLLRKTAPDISHIVIMGMGEPFLNLPELRGALCFFTEDADNGKPYGAQSGLAMSKRRITVSTCGIENALRDFTANGPDIKLALSLTTAQQTLRERLMPLTARNPLPAIRRALVEYQAQRARRITLEMVLLSGVNTTRQDADAAADFVFGGAPYGGGKLDAVLNLIPWNEVDGLRFEGAPLRPPTVQETARFADELKKRGLNVTVRYKKGTGVSGACGQLGRVE